jgi:hypothetical protein
VVSSLEDYTHSTGRQGDSGAHDGDLNVERVVFHELIENGEHGPEHTEFEKPCGECVAPCIVVGHAVYKASGMPRDFWPESSRLRSGCCGSCALDSSALWQNLRGSRS